jgi:hypothetical protein
MVQMFMKKPSIHPCHQNLLTSDKMKNRGGIILSMLKSHTGTPTKNISTALNAQLLNMTTFRRPIPKNGR